jgi:hypothetical protein
VVRASDPYDPSELSDAAQAICEALCAVVVQAPHDDMGNSEWCRILSATGVPAVQPVWKAYDAGRLPRRYAAKALRSILGPEIARPYLESLKTQKNDEAVDLLIEAIELDEELGEWEQDAQEEPEEE